MGQSSSPSSPVEIVQAFIKAAAFDRDEEAVKKLVTKASAAQGNFNPPPDAHEMTITLGEPTQEGDEWVVPMTIANPKDPSQPDMKMPMTLTIEDGQWKIDMIRTMDRMFGGSMEKVMDGMVDALKGVGEAMAEGMKQAFDGIGEAMSGAFSGDGSNHNQLPDGAAPGMAAIFDNFNNADLPDQLALMREALGNELTVSVDWSTFEGDEEAASRLTRKVLHTLRSAVCLSCSDDKIRDALRQNLHEVLITHVAYPEGKLLNFTGNRLHITTNLNEAGPAIGWHKSDEIIAALRDALDADKGPAVDWLLGEAIPSLKEQIFEHVGLNIDIDIDLASFMDAYDTDTAVNHLKKIERDVFRNLVYHLAEVDKKVPLHRGFNGLRLEHVASAQFRALFACGDRIVYRLCFTEDGGHYYGSEMDDILPGVVANLPDYSDPYSHDQASGSVSADTAPTAFGIISDYRDQAFRDLQGKICEAVGRLVNIDIDWASIGDDVYAADQLRIWGLNRVVGAARLVALDQQAQQDMIDTITSIKLICVPTIEEKKIEVEDGVLTLHLCLTEGERGCYYERDIATAIIQSLGSELKPILADLRHSAKYWEQEMAGEEHRAPITYYIDFAGFTSSPDDQKNRFALTLLKEHGIDTMYYAVTRLFEKNPNFAQQFRQRVRRFVINHVDDAMHKRVGYLDDAIVYECFLHEGYKGYLTIDDLVKRLPGVVAEMSDIPAESTEALTGYDSATDAEKAELDELGRFEDEMESDDTDTDSDEESAEVGSEGSGEADLAFPQMRTQIMQMLPNFSQQFAAMLGKPIPVTIDWESLEGDPMALSVLLNASLTPIMGGLAALSQEPGYRDDVVKFIDEIELHRAASAEDQAIRLHEGVLTMSVFTTEADAPPMSPEEATSIFRGIIDYVRALPSEPKKTPKPKAKAPAKPTAKPAAKKPAPKKPEIKGKTKPAPKSAAKPKKNDKGKGKK